jgi:hypothetical protein
VEHPAGPKCTLQDNHSTILYKHNIIAQAAPAVAPGNWISSVQFTPSEYVFCRQHATLGPAAPHWHSSWHSSWHCSTLNGHQKSESFSRVLLSQHDIHKYRSSIGLEMMVMLWLLILFPSWMGLTPPNSRYVKQQLSLTCANILLAWPSSLALVCINWSTWWSYPCSLSPELWCICSCWWE